MPNLSRIRDKSFSISKEFDKIFIAHFISFLKMNYIIMYTVINRRNDPIYIFY